MHGQSTLDALGHQPRKGLNLIGMRRAEHTGSYRAAMFAPAYAADQLKIPKSPVAQTATARAVLSHAILFNTLFN